MRISKMLHWYISHHGLKKQDVAKAMGVAPATITRLIVKDNHTQLEAMTLVKLTKWLLEG